MTDDEKREYLENLKLLLKFHSESGVINKESEFWKHIDDILDEINRIEAELKK